jgi:HEPN domain-containing protein
MGRKRLSPGDPREWIRRAKSNLAMSGTVRDDVDFADLCFEAQQTAEKAIKAVFVLRGETFPYSHDLERLLLLLERNGQRVPKYVHAAKELTRFAHVTRYPGLASHVTKRAYRSAVRIAMAVLRWAERQVGIP